MAEELLVDNKIDDGQRFVDQLLADGFDITEAFWIKDNEGLWQLYIASPKFDDRKPGENYRAVRDSLSKVPDPAVQPWSIRLIDDRNPVARDVAKIGGRPSKKEPIRYQGRRLGDLPIQEVYIYPKPEIPVRQSFVITYTRKDKTNHWIATTSKKELYRALRPKGAVSYSTAQWLGGKEEDFAHVYVLVEVDPKLDEKTIATNPVILMTLAEHARSMADEMFRAKHPEATIEQQSLVMNLV